MSRRTSSPHVWLAAFLIVLAWIGGASAWTDRASDRPEIRASELTFGPTELFAKSVKSGTRNGRFVSSAVAVPVERAEPFLAVGCVVEFTTPFYVHAPLRLRSSADGVHWSAWRDAPVNHDATFGEPANVTRADHAQTHDLVFLEQETRFVKFDLDLSDPGALAAFSRLRLDFISPGATPDTMKRRIRESRTIRPNALSLTPTPYEVTSPPIVSRTDWGCPDGEKGRPGLVATTVTHLIVHHTATPNVADDWPAVVRSIWRFHIFTNGWSDIGYNYLIDPTGVVYLGRAKVGEDRDTQGAHFSGVNGGTMGVSMIGTYTSVAPPAEALASLDQLLAWKAFERKLDPLGTARHAASRLTLDTISGHRDGPAPTACPGDELYFQLPDIRNRVARLFLPLLSNVSPGSGAFTLDTVLPVTWETRLGNDETVMIALKRDGYDGTEEGESLRVVAQAVTNGGTAEVKLPTDLAPGDDWRVYVVHLGSGFVAAANGPLTLVAPPIEKRGGRR